MTGFRLLSIVTQNVLTLYRVMPSIIANNTPQAYGSSSAKSTLKSRGCFLLGLAK